MGVVRRAHGKLVWTRRVRALATGVGAELPQGARVLDIGCGDGSVAAAVMDLRPDVTITGIDVLIRPDTKIPVTDFDGETVPFEDRAFDAVTFVDVLHHTDDPVHLLCEAARVASGEVVIKDHLADGFLARPTLRVMDWVGNASFGVALPYNYWTEAQWLAGFSSAGLRVRSKTTRLRLYPRPLWWFERGLHVVWRLAPEPNVREGSG